MSDFDAAWKTIVPLVERMRELQTFAVLQYQSVVESVVRNRSHNVKHIERTPDGLLDFCDHAQVVAMFKQLCGHYWDIDPEATAYYLHSCLERWDSEEDEGQA